MINLQNQVLDKAFKYKQQGLREGSVFDISTADGKGMSLIGRQEYENGVPRDVYYEVTKTGYNTHVVNYDKPLTKNGVPITASELEDALLPWTDRQTTRPHKSKPNIEAEYYFNEDN